jgi:hypothetical protein
LLYRNKSIKPPKRTNIFFGGNNHEIGDEMEKTKKIRYSYRKKPAHWLLYAYLFCFIILAGLYAFKNNWYLTAMMVSIAALSLLTLLWILKISERHKFRRDMQKKLDYFLETNGLIIENIQRLKNGGLKITKYFPYINYYRDEKFLTVFFGLDGSAVSQKLYDVEEQLSDLFEYDFFEKEKRHGSIRYLFRLVEDKRLHVESTTDMSEFSADDKGIRITEELTWNPRKSPHGLVTGITGSGKTFFLAYLIKAFYSINAHIKIIDFKRSELSRLARIFGEGAVVYEPNDIAGLLQKTVRDMDKRYEEMEMIDKALGDTSLGKDFTEYGFHSTAIFFDEVMALMASIDKKLSAEITGYLTALIAKGKQAGFFVILSSQRADTEFVKGSIRDQMGLRVALGRVSSDGYVMTFGSDYRNLELNDAEKGSGFIFIDGVTSKPRKFKAPYIDTQKDLFSDLLEQYKGG